MKILWSAILILLTTTLIAQKKLCSTTVKTLDGKEINTADFSNNGKPMLVYLWETSCAPCTQGLKEIAPIYEIWQKKTGLKVIAVSIDDRKSHPKVKSYAEAQGWKYEVYLDDSREIMTQMEIENPLHLWLIDDKGTIVWEQDGYTAGDTDKLAEALRTLDKK